MDVYRAEIKITPRRAQAVLLTSEGRHTFAIAPATANRIIAVLVMEDPHCPSIGLSTPPAGTPSPKP